MFMSPPLNLILSQMNPVQILTPISLKHILILLFHLCLVFQVVFPSDF